MGVRSTYTTTVFDEAVFSIRFHADGILDDDVRIVYISPGGVRTILQDLQRNIGVYDPFPFDVRLDITITQSQAQALGVTMESGGSIEISLFDGWWGGYRASAYAVHFSSLGTIISTRGGANYIGSSPVPAPNPIPANYYTTGPHFLHYYVLGTHVIPLLPNYSGFNGFNSNDKVFGTAVSPIAITGLTRAQIVRIAWGIKSFVGPLGGSQRTINMSSAATEALIPQLQQCLPSSIGLLIPPSGFFTLEWAITKQAEDSFSFNITNGTVGSQVSMGFGSFGTLSFNLPSGVTGALTAEWWEYATKAGLPVYNTSTGAQLRDPQS